MQYSLWQFLLKTTSVLKYTAIIIFEFCLLLCGLVNLHVPSALFPTHTFLLEQERTESFPNSSVYFRLASLWGTSIKTRQSRYGKELPIYHPSLSAGKYWNIPI